MTQTTALAELREFVEALLRTAKCSMAYAIEQHHERDQARCSGSAAAYKRVLKKMDELETS